MTVAGGVNNEDGSVTYTREQLEQLLQHVTTPHIVHRAPAAPVMG